MDINWDAIFSTIERATPAAVKIVNTLKKKPKHEREATAQSIMTGVNVPAQPRGYGVSMTTIALVAGGGLVAFMLLRR